MKRVLQIAAILFGSVLLAAFFAPIPVGGILNSGNAAGLLFSVVILLYAVFYRRVHCGIGRLWKKYGGRVWVSAIAVIMAGGLSFTLFTKGCMVMAAKKSPVGTETVVVLGCQVRPDGPSVMLWERIDAAHAYLQAHPAAV